MAINKADYLADDNATYDIDKVNALNAPARAPTEATPDMFMMANEGEQVAGPWGAIGRAIRNATPSKYKQTKTVKQIRDKFRAENAETGRPMDPEETATLRNLQADAPSGPFTGTVQNELTGMNEARNVNLDNIRTPDDIKAVIDDMAQYQEGNFEARRGKISHEQSIKMAEDIDAIEQMTGWKPGTAWNAEQVTAARQLLVNTASQISVEAKRLTSNAQSSSEMDWTRFAQLQKTFAAMNSVVSGATAEAGRALSAHNIPIAGNDRTNAINSLLQEAGGPELLKKKAKLIAEAGDMSDEELARLVNDSLGAPNQGVLAEIWINAQLSSPVTHSVNIVSNSMVSVMESYMVKPTAATIGAIRKSMGKGSSDAISFEEVGAETYGMMNSFGEAITLFADRLREKEGTDLFLTPSKVEMEHWNAFSSKRLLPATAQGSSFARAIDFIGDWYVRLPGRFLESEDLFFKTLAYRKELNSMAVRTAKSEGLEGESYARRVNELINSPNQQMNDAASTRADYETFTSDPAQYDSMFGNLSQAITYMTARHSSLKFIVPFVRTPTNIMRYAVENSMVSPVSKKWRTDFQAGGAKRDMALARWSLGTVAYASIANMYEDGMITGSGPTDPATRNSMRELGWQPNSIKIGDTYYSYNRSEPMGIAMSVLANSMDHVKYANTKTEGTTLALDTILSLGEAFQDKTFMTSFAELFNAVGAHEGSAKAAARYGNSIAAGFVPAWLKLVSDIGDTIDNKAVVRSVNPMSKSSGSVWVNLEKQMKNRTPGRKYLPAQRNWKGELVTKSGGGFWDEMFFIERSKAKTDPATKLLLDNWVAPRVPDQKQTFVIPEAIQNNFPQAEFTIDLLDLDENGGQVYEVFQMYVGRRRKQFIDKAMKSNSFNGIDPKYMGNNSITSTILETLLQRAQTVAKKEFFKDYNKNAKQYGWREMDDEAILEYIEMNTQRGKEFPVPDAPQEQQSIGF